MRPFVSGRNLLFIVFIVLSTIVSSCAASPPIREQESPATVFANSVLLSPGDFQRRGLARFSILNSMLEKPLFIGFNDCLNGALSSAAAQANSNWWVIAKYPPISGKINPAPDAISASVLVFTTDAKASSAFSQLESQLGEKCIVELVRVFIKVNYKTYNFIEQGTSSATSEIGGNKVFTVEVLGEFVGVESVVINVQIVEIGRALFFLFSGGGNNPLDYFHLPDLVKKAISNYNANISAYEASLAKVERR